MPIPRAEAAGAAARPTARRRRGAKLGTKLLTLLVATGATLLAGELALRHLLFGDSALARRYGEALRFQGHYGVGPHEDDYWKLQALLNPNANPVPPGADPLLGWMGAIESGTFAHPGEHTLGGRRPILLFGDSNAECLTGPDLCFQGLLERSDLGATHALLNFGIGGYGLDQIYLMLRGALARYGDRDPIVVVSLMVDDDLERSMLSFRGWPKPRLRVEDGALLEPEPVDNDTRRFLREHPPAIRSYLYRLVSGAVRARRGPDARLGRSPEHLAELRTLNRALLDAMRAELVARELDHLFFLFYFETALRGAAPAVWSEEIVLDFLRESGAPAVSLGDAYRALCDPPWACLEELAGLRDPTLAGHLNDGGNRLAFEVLRQGLAGGLDPGQLRRMADEGAFRPTGERHALVDLLGRELRTHTRALYNCFRIEPSARRPDRVALGLRAGEGLDTTLTLRPAAGDRRLLASATCQVEAGRDCPEPVVRLRWRLEGGPWQEQSFTAGEPALPLAIELAGGRELTLVVSHDGPTPECAWLALRGLRFE